MRMRHKTAIITGGSSGIGLATAILLRKEGANVVATGLEAPSQDVRRKLGDGCLLLQADISSAEDLARVVRTTVDHFGEIDVVFANAGIYAATPLIGGRSEDFLNVIKVNLLGTFLTVQAAEPHLAKGASIILNGSLHASLGIPGACAYAASKSGVRTMCRVMASELASRHIRVNVVAPGPIWTPIYESRVPSPEAKAQLESRYGKAVPLGRFGAPEEIAHAVLYLASDESRYTNASELLVDGGTVGAPTHARWFQDEP